MKKHTIIIVCTLLLLSTAISSCAPKTSCGNTKHGYKKKNKEIRNNPNFKM